MRSICFIGAGKVACTVGKYLAEHGVPISGYMDTDMQSADSAADFAGTRTYEDMSSLVAISDIIFISTPDDVIPSVWDDLKTMDIKDKIIGIFSGSLSSEIFSGIESTGAHGVSAHPMYAFSDRFSDYRQLHTARFTLEGDDVAVAIIQDMLEHLGHKVVVIDPEKKARYHAAASIASNLMIGLYDLSLDMLTDCGFTHEDAVSFLSPLITKNVTAMLTSSPADALTGPIERGDTETITHHLEVLSPDERDIYLPLARRLTDIAGKKNPGRNYEAMMELLRDKPQ